MAVMSRDPRVKAPQKAYLRDVNSTRLVYVLESDASGVLVEDCLTFEWFSIDPRELMQQWYRVWAQRTDV